LGRYSTPSKEKGSTSGEDKFLLDLLVVEIPVYTVIHGDLEIFVQMFVKLRPNPDWRNSNVLRTR
jgi:hypothetical protein